MKINEIILNEIYDYIKKTDSKPNVVYLGHKEFYDLKRWVYHTYYKDIKPDGLYFYGIRVLRVYENNYLKISD